MGLKLSSISGQRMRDSGRLRLDHYIVVMAVEKAKMRWCVGHRSGSLDRQRL